MELNDNILFAYGDYVASATVLNPTSFEPRYPASNLQDSRQWLFGRFSSYASTDTYIELDFGQSRSIDLVATIKHNGGRVAKWRIRLASTQANLVSSPTFDSGWLDMLPTSTGWGALSWGDFDWGGVSSKELLEQYNLNAFYPMASTVQARFMRVDYDDADEAAARTDSWLQLARLWASSGYQPSLNVAYGAEVIPIDETTVSMSRSGVRHYSPLKVLRRAIAVSLPDIPKKELFYALFGPLYIKLGKSAEVIAILEPTDEETFAFSAIYGNVKDVDKAIYSSWVRMTMAVAIEEAV